jgi:hypothetical protein
MLRQPNLQFARYDRLFLIFLGNDYFPQSKHVKLVTNERDWIEISNCPFAMFLYTDHIAFTHQNSDGYLDIKPK